MKIQIYSKNYLKMKLLIFAFFFFFSNLSIFNASQTVAKESCEIKNILFLSENLKCSDNDLIFAYLSFDSEYSNHKYTFNKIYNVDIIEEYQLQIRNFLINYCKINNKIKIKYIINFNKIGQKKYNNRIIISCNYKS